MRLACTSAATALACAAVAAVPTMAAAETTTTIHTATVDGVGEVPISAAADQAAAIAAYRAGLAAAVADALSKAQFLAGAVGTTVDSAVSPGIVEGSGYISCPAEVEYTGHQPDWSSGGSVALAPAVSRSSASVKTTHPPTVHRKSKPKPKHKPAKKSSLATCTLAASLSITYVLQ